MLALILGMTVATGSIERALPVASFHAVDLATKATVRVEQAPVASVVAIGDPRFVRCVTAEVRDGRLVLSWAGRRKTNDMSLTTRDEIIVTARADCRHEGDPQSLVIRVTAPTIDGITIREQGVVQVSPVRATMFAASIPGRGSITINGLRAGTTKFSITGIGRIAATGELGRLGIDVPGSGVIDTRAAHASAINAVIAGHGDVIASVDGPVSGTFGGAGTVAVAGHPACAIRKLGSGRIICPAGPPKGIEG